MLNKQFLWRVQGLAAWQRKPRLISHSCRIHAIREFYTRMEYLIGRKFGFIWNNVRVRESSLEETRLDIVKIAILIATWSPRRLKKIKKESDRFNFARRIGQHLDHFEMENVRCSQLNRFTFVKFTFEEKGGYTGSESNISRRNEGSTCKCCRGRPLSRLNALVVRNAIGSSCQGIIAWR